MTARPDPDDRLTDVLASVLDATEAAPAPAVDQAVALFTLRVADAELMTLLEDSAVSASPSRSVAERRLLAFGGTAGRIELDIAPDGTDVIGEIDPPEVNRVELRTTNAVIPVVVDPAGRFRVTPPASGPARFVVRTSAGHVWSTPVVVL